MELDNKNTLSEVEVVAVKLNDNWQSSYAAPTQFTNTSRNAHAHWKLTNP